MATTTKTVTVNAAFLQEIKEVHQELWQLLDELREGCRNPVEWAENGRATSERFARLMDQLALHFALEEAYGYFEDPAYAAPHLCERAESLRQQHRPLYLDVCQLAQEAEELARSRAVHGAMRLSQHFERFDRQLKQHEAEEMILILQAYDEDLGVGD